jgi:hypothetical protein
MSLVVSKTVRSLSSVRFLVALALALFSVASAQAVGTIDQADFTQLATQILTYLGYAVAAGLTVLVAVIGARRAWTFMRGFL